MILHRTGRLAGCVRASGGGRGGSDLAVPRPPSAEGTLPQSSCAARAAAPGRCHRGTGARGGADAARSQSAGAALQGLAAVRRYGPACLVHLVHRVPLPPSPERSSEGVLRSAYRLTESSSAKTRAALAVGIPEGMAAPAAGVPDLEPAPEADQHSRNPSRDSGWTQPAADAGGAGGGGPRDSGSGGCFCDTYATRACARAPAHLMQWVDPVAFFVPVAPVRPPRANALARNGAPRAPVQRARARSFALRRFDLKPANLNTFG